MLSFALTDRLCLVSEPPTVSKFILTYSSFLPESPRYLISKDRRDEAFDILVKYHVSGSRSTLNSILIGLFYYRLKEIETVC